MRNMRYRNKYNNKKCRYKDRIFHSRREAGDAMWLDSLIKQGKIKDFECQHKIDIRVNGKHICNHYVDFLVILNDGSKKYVETKGFQSETWIIKKKLVEATNEIIYLVNPKEDELLK